MIVIIFALVVLAAPSAFAQDRRSEPPVTRGVEDPKVIVQTILEKLSYDRQYFQRVLRHESAGSRPDSMRKAEFAREVRRATRLSPVLEEIFASKSSYEAGKYLPQLDRGARTRVYDNLVGLLNMCLATQRGDPKRVLSFGSRINVRDLDDLGVRVRGEPAYRLRLLREYFGLMGWAAFRVGQDREVNRWFRKIVRDKRMKALRNLSGEEGLTPEEKRIRRASRLRLATLAVMPLENLGGQAEDDWWKEGLMEVLISDLSNFTDLELVERSQLDKIVYEYELRYFRDEKEGKSLDKLLDVLDAASLLIGSYIVRDDTFIVQLRLVDPKDGLILGAEDGSAARGEEFALVRALTLKILEKVEWVEPMVALEITQSRAPKAEAIRDLVRARALMTTQEAEARRLYESALQTDPTYASAFRQLKEKYPDVKAFIAIAPFENRSGAADDAWILGAVHRALHADLATGGFDIIPRETVARNLQVHEVLKEEQVPAFGKTVDASFVVIGALARSGSTVRLDARLVSVQTAEILFSDFAEGPDDGVPELLAELSEKLLRAASQHLSEDVLKTLTGRRLSEGEFRDLGTFDAAQRAELAKKPEKVAQERSTTIKRARRDPFAARGSRFAVSGGVLSDRPTMHLRYRFLGRTFRPLTNELVFGFRDFHRGRNYQDLRAHYRLLFGANLTSFLYLEGGTGVGIQVPSSSDELPKSDTALTVPAFLETGLTTGRWAFGVEGGIDYVATGRDRGTVQAMLSLVVGVRL